MEAKKNPKYSLTRTIPMFRLLGLTISLSLVTIAFEWPSTQAEEVMDLGDVNTNDFQEIIEIPPTEQPPPPPPNTQIKEIVVVPDEAEIEEELDVELDVEVIEETRVEAVVFEMAEMEVEEVEEVFVVVEDMPEFPGGIQEFYASIGRELNYPDQALRLGIEGRVYVEFTVDRDGALTDVHVVKGIGAGCDTEAVRVIRTLPNFIPGKQRGKPVKVKMVLPVLFKMAES